jgi:hypothetical protein
VNAETLRRLAAVDMPAEALREVLTIFAEIEAKNEERRARDAARKKHEREARKVASADCPRIVQGMSNGSPVEVPHAPAPAREEVLTSLDSISKVSKERPPKGGPKKGFKSQVSEDIQPTEKDRAVAEREGMSPDTFRLEWQKWRSHHVSEAKPVANMHQSWVKWASNWVSYGRRQADQPARAGPAKSSSGNGFSVLLDELRAKRNGQQSSANEPRDITPTSIPEPRAGDPGSHLSDPVGKPSGGGEILDFRSASPDSRRSAAPFGEAARTFDWDDPLRGTFGGSRTD